MASINEQILRTTKEIVLKFIEGGRVSPSGVHELFKSIYNTVEESVKDLEKNNKKQSETPNQTQT
ncbi:MAG TPA: conjugal transfer protein TraB [Desulfobacterales bacterium]|nr:conjugal transfer protein TraB [Desulfobacterales bacterium]